MKVPFVLAAMAASALAQAGGPGMNVTGPSPGTNITNLEPFEVDIMKMVSALFVVTDESIFIGTMTCICKAKNPVQIDIAIQIDAISHKDDVARNLYNGTFNITQDVPPIARIHVVPDNLPKGPATLNITHYWIAGVSTLRSCITVNLISFSSRVTLLLRRSLP